MPTVHVLGNGPSIQHFESDLFHTEPTDGIRVGCNLTYPHLNPVWTVLGRDLLFYICENKIDFTIPVVTFTIDIRKVGQNTRNPEHLNSLNYHCVLQHYYTWSPVVQRSSGHSACLLAIQQYNPELVHLWGFDVLWSHSNKSVHDDLTRNKSISHNRWKETWIEIFSTYPRVTFRIHTPTPIENLPKNVVTERL